MKEEELQIKAIEEIRRHIQESGPQDPRVVHCWTETNWDSIILRDISRNRINILGPMPDILVFFNTEGKMTGWRDEGCQGTEKPSWMDSNAFLRIMIEKLDLPEETRLSFFQVKKLPPLGWTYEGILFLNSTPEPEEILRVWVSPRDLRIIQVLYGSSISQGG